MKIIKSHDSIVGYKTTEIHCLKYLTEHSSYSVGRQILSGNFEVIHMTRVGTLVLTMAKRCLGTTGEIWVKPRFFPLNKTVLPIG